MSISSISLSVTGLADTLTVARFSGRERLSGPFRFDITCVSTNIDIDPQSMLNRSVTMTIESATGGTSDLKVSYHGIATEFEQGDIFDSDSVRSSYYRVVLEPRLSRLARSRNTAAYVDAEPETPSATVLTVVAKVLDRYAPNLPYRLPTVADGTLRKRAFRCQFQESDLDFIGRLLESEGLYYYFDHSEQSKGEQLVIAYNASTHAKGPRDSVVMQPDSVLGQEPNMLSALIGVDTLLPETVVLRDYDPARAGNNGGLVTATASVHPNGSGEFVLNGEGITTSDANGEGPILANVRAEELHCRGRRFIGEGPVVGLRTGYTFRLSGHARASMNSDYLVTEMEHEGSQAQMQAPPGTRVPVAPRQVNGYRVTALTAIPHGVKIPSGTGRTVQFRPARTTPRPRVQSTISATIDDPGSGHYAQPDSKGRYKIVLPFAVYPVIGGAPGAPYVRKSPPTEASPPADSETLAAGKGSAWVRMATPYSGGASASTGNDAGSSQVHGMHLPLHRGTEVLLAFIEGDPDQPIIVGTVPNSTNRSVVDSTNKTMSRIVSAGGSTIEVDDQHHGKRISMMVPESSVKNDGASARSARGVSYLRLGSAAKDQPTVSAAPPPASTTTTSAGSTVPNATGVAPGGFVDDESKYTVFIWTDGDAKIFTKGSLVQATGDDIDFGTTPWELLYSWQVVPPGTNPNSNKQVSASDTIEHSFGDNIERTIGKNVTVTVGDNEEYTYGNNKAQTIGNSIEWVIGTSETYIGWDDWSLYTPGLVSVNLRPDDPSNHTTNPNKTVPSRLPDLSAAGMVPRIGLSTWETPYSWGGAPADLGWDATRWANAVKEVNWLDSVSHSKGDSVERVKGNSYSETRGNSFSETHGDTKDRTWGNANAHTFGRSDEMFLGGQSSFFLGAQAELNIAASTGLALGGSMDLEAAVRMAISLSLSMECALGTDVELHGATSVKIDGGVFVKVSALEVKTAQLEASTKQLTLSQGSLTLIA